MEGASFKAGPMPGETKSVSLIFVASFSIVGLPIGHLVVLRISHYCLIITILSCSTSFSKLGFSGEICPKQTVPILTCVC